MIFRSLTTRAVLISAARRVHRQRNVYASGLGTEERYSERCRQRRLQSATSQPVGHRYIAFAPARWCGEVNLRFSQIMPWKNWAIFLIAVVGLGIAIAVAVRSALANFWTTAVPGSTGVSRIGTLSMRLVDPHREDPYHSDGAKRELMVRFWYPGAIGQKCRPAEYASPKVWTRISQISGFPLPRIRTNSCLEAPITAGPHPVIIFTHGYTGMFTDSTFLFEDLASRGYVVASVAHSYETTAVEFPDGKLVKSSLGSHLDNSWLLDDQSLSKSLSARIQDLRSVVTALGRLNEETGGPFMGRLDLSRIGLAGHSLGGLAVLRAIEQDSRFKAALILDGTLSEDAGQPIA